jgi:hypothetical protein
MRKRKFQIIFIGCLLAVLAFWLLRPPNQGTGDEQRYRQMLRAQGWGWRLNSAQKQLPGALVRLFRVANLKQTYVDKADAQAEALLASGYLTSVSITITNLPLTATNEKSSLAEVQRRLRSCLQGDAFCSFYMQSNQALITCRTSDLALFRRALQSP